MYRAMYNDNNLLGRIKWRRRSEIHFFLNEKEKTFTADKVLEEKKSGGDSPTIDFYFTATCGTIK